MNESDATEYSTDDLRAAANAAYAELEKRGVDVEGVAPVLRDDPTTTIVLSPVSGPARRLRLVESDVPGSAFALEEAQWDGCAWRSAGREELLQVEIDGVAYNGSESVVFDAL